MESYETVKTAIQRGIVFVAAIYRDQKFDEAYFLSLTEDIEDVFPLDSWGFWLESSLSFLIEFWLSEFKGAESSDSQRVVTEPFVVVGLD